MPKIKERDLYPRIERWLKRHFHCFATATNAGLKYSRPDVIGVRDVGGDLSGEVESIIIEVKRGNQPFATASGQALGYKVYANRIFLADVRETRFSVDEIHIASHLGIGLIQIKGTRCIEVLTSPYHDPITKLNYALLERLAHGYCQLCGSLFEIGNNNNRYSNLSRENLQKAFEAAKGVIFWNREVGIRKKRLGIRSPGSETVYERRFICPDCVSNFLAQFKLFNEA